MGETFAIDSDSVGGGAFMAPPTKESVNDLSQFDFVFSGVYTWGEVISLLCREGTCRTQLPRDFFSLSVPLNIYETNFENAFKALTLQALADGYILKKSGRKKPYLVTAVLDEDSKSSYISCLDTSVRVVNSRDLFRYKYVDSLKCVSRKRHLDSLAGIVDTISFPSIRYRVSFYVVSSNFLRTLGVNWTELWAKGSLTDNPHFITNWALQAVSQNDTTAEFRSVEVDLDSLTTLHWGSQKKEQKTTIVYSNGVGQTDYEYKDYGLTLTLKRDLLNGIRAEYQLAQRDENNSVLRGSFGGGGKDSISAWGVYDSYQNSFRGIPFLSSIPLIGYFFGSENRDKVKSFFVIEVYPISRDTTHFPMLDSLRYEDIKRYENIQNDTTDNQLDTLHNEEN